MNRSVLLLSAIGAALLAGAPARADSSLPWNDEVGQWFVAPFVGMTFVDDDRLLDDDLIYGASVGKHLDERWSAQLTGYSSDFDNDGLRPEWTWPATFDGSISGLSFDLMRVFARDSRISPYLLGGAGYQTSDYEGTEGDSNVSASLGLGLMWDLARSADGSRTVQLRPEVRSRWDLQRGDTLNDLVAQIGLAFGFGPPPVVAADQVLRDGEAEARAALPARHERVEDRVLQLGRHARPVVLDLDAGDDSIASAADAGVRERARAQHDASPLAHGLDRIAPEIEQRLDDLVAIQPQARQARIVIALDRDACGRFRGQQVTDVLHQLVDIDGLLPRRLAGAEQRVDERRQPIGFGDDHRRVFVQAWIPELALEQLRRPAQATERILDLVCKLPNHRATAAELRQQRVLAQDSLVLGDVGNLDDDPAREARRLERRDRQVDEARRRGRATLERELAPRVLCARASRTSDHRLEFGVSLEHLADRSASRVVAADGEQILGRLVKVQDRAFGIEPQHARREAVEQLGEFRARGTKGGSGIRGHVTPP